MSGIDFQIEDWEGGGNPENEDSTLASFRLTVSQASNGSDVIATRVDDSNSKTVRDRVYLPMAPLAEWLVVNWWRLRWEPFRPSLDWQIAHSISTIGSGCVWPSMSFASDGQFVRILQFPDSDFDVSSIRYLSSVDIEIPVSGFEKAVFQFAEQVTERFSALGESNSLLAQAFKELQSENADPEIVSLRKHEAIAGWDAEEAPKEWFEDLRSIQSKTGETAFDEVLASFSEATLNFSEQNAIVDELESSKNEIRIPDFGLNGAASLSEAELPWETGARVAKAVRGSIGNLDEPIGNKFFETEMGVKFGDFQYPNHISGMSFCGGIRSKDGNENVRWLPTSTREENQRFYLARILGSDIVLPKVERLLPVTDAKTALQKFERSFAQELLCPESLLAEFISNRKVDEALIERASDHFNVSERLIETTLVNKAMVPRFRFPQIFQ